MATVYIIFSKIMTPVTISHKIKKLSLCFHSGVDQDNLVCGFACVYVHMWTFRYLDLHLYGCICARVSSVFRCQGRLGARGNNLFFSRKRPARPLTDHWISASSVTHAHSLHTDNDASEWHRQGSAHLKQWYRTEGFSLSILMKLNWNLMMNFKWNPRG